MTQNTEQNTWTREDREQEIAIMLCKARGRDPFQMTYQTIEPGIMEPYGDAWCHYIPEAKAVLEWHEAEARGAEEQRRKDAEHNETPSAWVRPDDFYRDEGDERFGPWYSERSGKYTVPLYTRPANVAALKARIAELEEAATTAITLIRGGRQVLARTTLQRVTTDRAICGGKPSTTETHATNP